MLKADILMLRLLTWLLLFLLVNICTAKDIQSIQPCWLESPLVQKEIGQIGVARNINFGNKSPSTLAKMRATASLCASLGVDCKAEELEKAVNTKVFQAKPLYFDTFIKNGYIYAYSGFARPPAKKCKPLNCDITTCDPDWLCSPTQGKEIGILGVSYRATSPAKQIEMTIKNALFQAEYLYGVKVSAIKELSQSRIGTQQFSIKLQQADINFGGDEKIAYFIANQCRRDGTLFSHVRIAGDLTKQTTVDSNDLTWLKNPKHLGLDGAVGAVERLAASGLVSDQIELAIKRAAISLAFEKNSQISEQTLTVTSKDYGIVHVNNISETSNASLKAQVKAIHFKKGKGTSLKVFVWLVFV